MDRGECSVKQNIVGGGLQRSIGGGAYSGLRRLWFHSLPLAMITVSLIAI